MKKALIAFLLIAVMLPAAAQIRINDANNGSPIPFASIFLANGTCVGVSSTEGILTLPKGYTGSITVQHINFENKTFSTDTVTNATVALIPYTYSVPETVCKYERPDYMKISAYARSYYMSDSIPASFSDGIYYFYIPLNGGKVKRKQLSARQMYRSDLLEDGGDWFLYKGKKPRLSTSTVLASLKSKGLITENMGTQVLEHGKRGLVRGIRTDSVTNTMDVYSDSLFTANDYKISLFGISARFTNMGTTETYSTANGIPKLKDLHKISYYICCYWRIHGKKRPEVRVDEFSELFVTGISYASKNDMKADLKDKTVKPVEVPPTIPELSPSLAKAVANMKSSATK